jgi:type II secretory pathway predicted ATPase ExeA
VYEAHFGLTQRPFGETVSPSSYIALSSRESVSRRLRYGLEQGQGPALLFGPAGSGKTLVARRLATTLGGESAHLAFPAMPADELLAYLADELGVGSGSGSSSTASSIRRLRRRFAETAATGHRTLLIVDEVHLIDESSTFEVLRTLQNFATLGPPDLMLLLVGGPEVLLRMPNGLADRLTARCLLGPLSEQECADYILGRLAASGARTPLFPADSLAALYRAGDGLPRRLNRLADFALLVAYAEGLDRAELPCVKAAARELDPEIFAA